MTNKPTKLHVMYLSQDDLGLVKRSLEQVAREAELFRGIPKVADQYSHLQRLLSMIDMVEQRGGD